MILILIQYYFVKIDQNQSMLRGDGTRRARNCSFPWAEVGQPTYDSLFLYEPTRPISSLTSPLTYVRQGPHGQKSGESGPNLKISRLAFLLHKKKLPSSARNDTPKITWPIYLFIYIYLKNREKKREISKRWSHRSINPFALYLNPALIINRTLSLFLSHRK